MGDETDRGSRCTDGTVRTDGEKKKNETKRNEIHVVDPGTNGCGDGTRCRNLHKRLHGIAFKKRAPRAVKEIKAFAKKAMQVGERCNPNTHLSGPTHTIANEPWRR